jgi:two-component sensor histidine kinase
MAELVVRSTNDGTIVHVNDALCRLARRTAEDLRGSSVVALLESCGLHDIQGSLDGLSEAVPLVEHDATWERSDGASRLYRWWLVAQIDERGRLIGVQSVGRPLDRPPDPVADPSVATSQERSITDDLLHRIKNSMALVSSLVGLQCDADPDPHVVNALRSLRGRVQVVALAYELQHTSRDHRRIDLAAYTTEIARTCRQSLSSEALRARLRIEPASILVDFKRAVPFGLILSELISNSMVHGFPDGREGTIWIALRDVGAATAELEVRDDGVGADDEGELEGRRGGLGLQLVELLAAQLGGTFEIRWGNGVDARVRFPASES